jgi:hypothetical protein
MKGIGQTVLLTLGIYLSTCLNISKGMSVSNGNREAPHIFLQSNILLDSSWKYNSSAPKVSKDFKSTNNLPQELL